MPHIPAFERHIKAYIHLEVAFQIIFSLQANSWWHIWKASTVYEGDVSKWLDPRIHMAFGMLLSFYVTTRTAQYIWFMINYFTMKETIASGKTQ